MALIKTNKVGFVKDGVIIDGPMKMPRKYGSTGGLYNMTTIELKEFGFREVWDDVPEFDPKTSKRVGYGDLSISGDIIVRPWIVVVMDDEEVTERARSVSKYNLSLLDKELTPRRIRETILNTLDEKTGKTGQQWIVEYGERVSAEQKKYRDGV